MPHLFWNPLAVNFLIEAILATLLALYFAWELAAAFGARRDTRIAALLFMTLGAAALGTVIQMFAHSVHPDLRDYLHPWVSPAGAIAMTGFVLFAYYFQRQTERRKWPGRVLTAALVCVVVLELTIATGRVALLGDGLVEFREAWVDIPFTIGFLAAHFFFARALAEAISREAGHSGRGSIGATLRAIFWPFQPLAQDARVARAFFYVAIAPSIFGPTLVAQSYGLLDWRLIELFNTWTFLATLAGFAIVYLNYIADWVTMRIKWLGITLTVVLSICSGFSWLIGSQYVDAYRNEVQIPDQTAIRFEPQPGGGFSVARTGYYFDRDFGFRLTNSEPPLDLPFLFPFYDKKYSQIFAREAGIIGFKFRPLWRDVQHKFGPQPALFLLAADLAAEPGLAQSGMYAKTESDRVTLTWNRLVSKYGPVVEYTFQLRLYATGVVEMIYEELPDNPSPQVFVAHATPMMMGIVPGPDNREIVPVHFATDLPFHLAPGAGMMEHFRIDFLRYLDHIYFPIALFISFISLLLLLVFPRFFQANFNRPLQSLISGVRDILDGKLSTEIEVHTRDELGFLAASFNEMAQAQHELVHTLEERVAERTGEVKILAAKTARLEERSRWTRELHDAVSQTLFSANLIADTLPKLWLKEPETAREAVEKIRQLNKDALSELRHLLLEAQPEKLSSQTFGKLLKESAHYLQSYYTLEVTVKIERDASLPSEVQIAFYRVARECLINAAKHAKANSVEVYFDGTEKNAILTVTDDGIGFDISAVPEGHFGLSIMHDRITNIGGNFEVETGAGEGTIVTATWIQISAC